LCDTAGFSDTGNVGRSLGYKEAANVLTTIGMLNSPEILANAVKNNVLFDEENEKNIIVSYIFQQNDSPY